jgi:hypothetical protein
MSLRSDMLVVLPPYGALQRDIIQKQGTNDIIDYVLEEHEEYETDYDAICEFFDTGTLRGTCINIWNFLKYNLKYNAEPESNQTTKSPAAILQPNITVDCKHYSLFIAGVLDAICRQYAPGWDWNYYFVSDTDVNNITHVFVVACDANEEYWIDPCLAMFDQRKKYILTKRYGRMLSKISGVNDGVGKLVDVDKQVAWISFLTMITMNFCGIKDIILSDMATTENMVKPYCISNGFDYDQLIRFINA